MVRSGNRNGFDFLVGEHIAHILKLFGFFACILNQARLSHFAGCLVHIAQARDARTRQMGIDVEMARPAATQSDDGNVNLVVGAPNAGGGRRRGRAEKEPAG